MVSKKKKTFFFEFLNQISFTKNPNFYNDETSRDWNSWMVLRYLSMDESLLPLVNSIQEFQSVLDGQQMYTFLCQVIPKKKRFFRYIKGSKQASDSTLSWVSRLYNCSKKEAQEYIDILGPDWGEEIKKSFGEEKTPKKTTSLRNRKR